MDFKYRVLPGVTIPMGRILSQDYLYLDINPTAFWELQHFRPDVVVIGGYSSLTNLQTYWQFKLQGKGIVMWGEATDRAEASRIRRLLLPLIRKLYRKADACLASSTSARKLYLSYGVAQDRIFLSPLAADNSFFHSVSRLDSVERVRIRASLGLTDKPVVLYVGRLVETKGVDLLIDALARLQQEKGIFAHLLLVGDGPLRPNLERRCRQVGISAHFAGYVEQQYLPRFYGVADVFVLPSYYEPFGLVLNEAMACQLPVVVSDRVGAADDLVVNGRNGYIFPAGDCFKLAEALERLLEDPTLCRAMGHASWEIIKEWDLERAVQGFVDAITLAASNRTARG